MGGGLTQGMNPCSYTTRTRRHDGSSSSNVRKRGRIAIKWAMGRHRTLIALKCQDCMSNTFNEKADPEPNHMISLEAPAAKSFANSLGSLQYKVMQYLSIHLINSQDTCTAEKSQGL